MIGKMRLQDIVPDKTSPTHQELQIIKSIFNGSVVEPEKPKEELQKEVVVEVEKPKETNALKFTLLFGVLVTFILLLNDFVYKFFYKINLSNMVLVTLIQVLVGMIFFYFILKVLKF